MKRNQERRTRHRRLAGLKKPGYCLCLCISAVILVLFLQYEKKEPPALPSCPAECDGFRSMRLDTGLTDCISMLMEQKAAEEYRLLAVLMAGTAFNEKDEKKPYGLPRTAEEYEAMERYYEKRHPGELALLQDAYQTILSDIRYFPIMKSSTDKKKGISGMGIFYEDAWLSERSYQNTSHLHEGTDIMAGNNRRGYYPVVSMTDGIVENIGWLEKGGYRIGIRSPHGGYFYYAHLYCYADGLKKGAQIKAGQLLGFMGDSGYSKVEGTVGNFNVHLHLGIYLKTCHYEELSVNPYWILRLAERQLAEGIYGDGV